VRFLDKEYSIKHWEGEQLPSPFALDTETTVVPRHLVPDVVTTQVYGGGDHVYFVSREKLNSFLEMHKDSKIICHNAAFDIRVLEKATGASLSEMYEKSLIWDTSILYRLLHLATVGYVPFKYNLAMLTKQFLGVTLDKEDSPRLDFGQYLGREDELPEEHLEYAARDAVATYKLYNYLCNRIISTGSDTYLSHNIQAAGDYALNVMHSNGIGFNLEKKNKWLAEKNLLLEQYQDKLASWGWTRGTKGVKDRYEYIIKALGITLPRTEDGSVSSKAEDLQVYRHFEFIDNYLKFIELEKATTFVRDVHEAKIHPRYNLLVNTGRTSCSKPNFQQLPRLGGIREMFQAGEGKTLLITDYSTIELATLAQVLLDKYGESVMADKINDGEDLHRYYASILYSKDPADVTKDERQSAKAANFGFPGGLGIDTFIEFSRGYGLELSRQEATTMRNVWFQAFPEMEQYLKGQEGYVMTRTGRMRGNTSFCAEKNSPFQGLAADGAKLALWYLNKAGFKLSGFVHDEIITEVGEDKAEEMLPIQEKIMVDAMKMLVPDVKVAVESQISKVYTK
jgi:DNA polymerase-1